VAEVGGKGVGGLLLLQVVLLTRAMSILEEHWAAIGVALEQK